MRQVEGTTLEFSCEVNEVVTIDITEKNTNYLASCASASYITVTGHQITIKVGTTSKTATIAFDFSGQGGSYDLVFNGTEGDQSFTRNISQKPNLPFTRTYVFHVS